MASVKSAAVNVSASVSGVCDGSLIRPLKCTGGVISTVWNGCLDRNSLIATGGVTDRFTVDATAAGDDDACNASLHPPGLTQDGVSMVRQIPMMSYDFGVAWKGNPLQGGKLVIDTAPPPAWDGTTFDPKGTVVSRQGLKRKIKINGLHEHLTSFSGKVIYDYSHSGEIIMTGALATADRSIDSGSQLVTWNNSSSTKIIHTFANDLAGNPVRWASTRCCFPVQGQVTSVYSGQVSGTTVMTFTGCAKANFVGLDGVKTPVSLSRCL